MKVVTTDPVDIAMRILAPDDRQRMQAWFNKLGDWDGDPYPRQKSALIREPDVYAMPTTDGTWIFFQKSADTITLLDIASQRTIDMHRPKA